MAKKIADIEAVINVKVNDDEIDELAGKLKNAQKIVDKNGVTYKVNVDDKGLISLVNTVKNINKNGANSIVLDFDEKATLAKLGSTETAIMKQFESFANKIRETLNNSLSQGIKGEVLNETNKDNASLNQLDLLNNKIKEKQSLLDETQSKIALYEKEEIASINNIQKAYMKCIGRYNDNDVKKLVGEFDYFMSKFDGDVSKLGLKDPTNNKQISGDIIESKVEELRQDYEFTNKELDKIQANLLQKKKNVSPFNAYDLDKFKANVEKLKIELKELNAEKEALIKADNLANDVSKDKINKVSSFNTALNNKKTDVNNIKNNKDATIDKKNIDKSNVLKSNIVEVKLVPKNIPEFYKEIENGGIANIKIKSEQSSVADLRRGLEAALSNVKVNLKRNLSIKNNDNIPSAVSSMSSGTKQKFGSDVNVEPLKSSVSEVIFSFKDMGSIFTEVTTNILNNSNKQIDSIKRIKIAVEQVNSSLRKTGIKSIDKFVNFEKEFEKLKQKRIEIDKKQVALKKQRDEIAKKTEDKDINKLTGSQMMAARDKLILAANNSKDFKLDTESIKFDKKGAMSFKAVIEDTGDAVTVASYKIKDFNKIVDTSKKLNKKYLDENTVGISNKKHTQEEIKKRQDKILSDDFLEAAKKTKNLKLDKDSLHIDSEGVLSFVRVIQKSGEEVKKVKYEIEDLYKVINSKGAIKQEFLSRNGSTLTQDKEIEKLTTEYLKAIDFRKKAEEYGDIWTVNGKQSEVEAINQERIAQQKLTEAIRVKNLSLEETNAIQNKISAEKKKKVDRTNMFEPSGRTELNEINARQKAYDMTFEKVNLDHLLNTSIQFEGEIVNIKTKMKELQIEATKLMEDLTIKQNFKNKDGFLTASKSLKDVLESINKLNSSKNKITNSLGDFIGDFKINKSLVEIDQSQLEKEIKTALLRTNQKVRDINIGKNGTKGSAYVINDDKIKKVNLNLREYQDELGKTTVRLRAVSEAETQYLSPGAQWVNGLKSKIRFLTQYVTGIGLVMRGWNELRQGFNFVKDLDSSLTTINQTMNVSKSQLQQLGDSSISVGKQFGASAESVLDAVAIYANANETSESILKKAEPTIMLSNASGADTATAADQIQAVVNQFEELKGQERRIVNSYEKISAGLAIDFAKGINIMAEGVQTSGSVAEEAGLKFETFASMVGKVSEVTRQEGSQIGNAMKTIMARVSRSKSADPDVTLEERSSAAKAYKSIGIELYDDQGQYQDFNKTLDELSSKWYTLTDAQRNYIAEESAGVRNINTFNAMMKTYAESKELASKAINDPSFIDETQEKHMDSMQGKLNSLRASMQEFWSSLLDTDVLKVGVDSLSGIVNIGENLIGVFSSIKKSIGGVTGGVVALGTALLTTVATFKTIRNMKTAQSLLGGLTLTGKNAKSGITGLLQLFTKSGRQRAFGGFRGLSAIANNWQKKGKGVIESFGEASAAGGGIRGLAAGFGALAGKIGISTTALAGFTAGFAGIALGVAAFNRLVDSTEETSKKIQELNTKYETTQNTFKNNRETIDDIGIDWVLLSEGVDSFGNNISLTTKEFSKYHEICNKIADMYPQLVSSYDNQGNAILKLKGDLEELNAEYDKQIVNESLRRVNEDAKTYQKDFDNKTGNRGFFTKIKDKMSNIFGHSQVGGDLTQSEALEILNRIKDMNLEEINKHLRDLKANFAYDSNAGVELSYLTGDALKLDFNMNESEWGNAKKDIINNINSLNTELETSATGTKSIIQDYINILTMSDGDYKNLDTDVVKGIRDILSKTSIEQLASLSKNKISLQEYVNNFVGDIASDKKAQISLKNLLEIDEKSSLEEIKELINKDLKYLDSVLEDDKNELKIKFGLEGIDDVLKSYDKIKKEISSDLDKQAKNTIKNLNQQVIESGGKLNINRKSKSSDELKKAGWETDQGIDSSYVAKVVEGKNKTFVLSPVLPTGEIMSPDNFEKYINEVILKSEKDTKGLSIATFDKKDVKNGKDTRKEADKFVKSLKEAEKYAGYLGDNQSLVKDFISQNNVKTTEQLNLLKQCYETTGNWAEAMSKFSAENIDLELNKQLLEVLESNLKVVKTNIDNIKQSIESTNTTIGMSREEINNVVKVFSELSGYNYDKLFESTAEGVKLNAQELERLNAEYEKQETTKYQNTINSLQEQYSHLCAEIDKTTKGTEKYYAQIVKRDGLKQQIKHAQELQSMYEGLTNSVTEYFNAKETKDPDVDYLNITKDIKNIQKMWEHGEIGRDDLQKFIQMFTNKELLSIEDYTKAYADSMSKAKRYFTQNGSGAETFLKDLSKKDSTLANVDSNGVWTIDASIETIAEKMDMTQAAVQEIFNRLKIFGFDVDFVEAEDYLRNMRDEALKANEVFKGIGDWKIDLDVSDNAKLREQVDLMESMKSVVKEQYGGANSKEFQSYIKQLDYLHAKLGDITKEEFIVDIHSDDGIKKLSKDVENLKKLGRIDIDIDFKNKDPKYIQQKIDAIIESAKDLKRNQDGTILIDQKGGQETISVLSALIQQQQNLKYNERVILDIDVSQVAEGTQQAIDDLKNVEKAYQELDTLQTMKEKGIPVDTQSLDEAKNKLIDLTKTFAEANPSVAATLKLNKDNINFDKEGVADKISATLSGITAKTMVSIEGVNDAALKNYNPDSKTVTFEVDDKKVKSQMNQIDAWVGSKKTLMFGENGLTSIYNSYSSIKDKTINIRINKTTEENSVNTGKSSKNKESGGASDLNGNVNFSGSAFSSGTVGAPKDEISLVGEENPELRVNSKTGRWELLGKNGAEFTKVNRGDLIFNANQTKELFKYGKVKSNGGRGRAFINGTVGKLNSLFKVGTGHAYVSGSFTTAGALPGSNKFYNNYKWNNNGKKGKEFKESFDWIEIAIDRIERAIKRLDTVANSAYKSFTKRNAALSEEFQKVTQEINLQQKAYNYYISKAETIGISSDYKRKVKNGEINVETITDENLSKKIKEYQELYEKALDASDAIIELKETLGDLVKSKFDNVVSQYDAQLNEIQHRIEMIESGLSIVEAKGNFAGKEYFQALMNTEQENINKLSQEYQALQKSFKEAMGSGKIEKNSEAYYDMQQQIRDVAKALQDAKLSLIEYQNQMREMDWSIFEKGREYAQELTHESDFIRELLSLGENDLFDKDTGRLNNKGQTVGGLHAMDYNVYMSQADEYRKKVEEINTELAKDPTNTILIDKKNEYLEAQREAILNAQNEKKAVKDLIADSYERMLDILQKLIDKKKEALQAEKDLYDYQNSIQEQTKNIKDYQKQLSALQGDDSEEAKSKKQQLETALEDAQKQLEETEYDKWLSDQERLMDDYYNEYEEFLNARLDDINGLMSEMITNTNSNSSMIDQTIKDSTNDVGYKITDGMNSIWNNTGGGMGKVVADYSNNFNSQLTTTNNYMKSINDLVARIVNKSVTEIKPNTGGVISGGGSSGGSSGSSGNSSSSSNNRPSNNGGNQGKGGFFRHKMDYYPKNLLRIDTSIVDRMKYHNFDTSWASLRTAYEGMGLGSAGSYTGSYNQNVAMLNWMKRNGFQNGGQLKSMINASGEDGLYLGRANEFVITPEQYDMISNVVEKLMSGSSLIPKSLGVNNANQNISANSEINLSINLPNVKDYESFKRELQKDPQFEKMIQAMTIGKATGKGSLNKFKY